MKTRMTELMGIKYPIIQGGMGWLGLAELVAAVSNAGGLGVLGSATHPDPEDLREEIRKVKKLTDKPFGVNIVMLPAIRELPNDGFVQVICEEGVPVVETAAGKPGKYIDALKRANVKIMHKVGSVQHARNAQKLGYDAVEVVGFESAGFPLPDDVTMWNLIPRIVDAVDIPVSAAGGTTDYRQLTAALALGADSVTCGTVFMATKECAAHSNLKQRLVEANEYDTVMIQRTINNQTRVFKNELALKVLEMEARKAPFEELVTMISGERGRRVYFEGDVDYGTISCGQGVGLIKDIPTVKEVIDRMVAGAEKLLKRLSS
ncbi:MAG: nitronate monooxygenase [Deltaproteobacteria bacterium]|nr:nitronate monooxygenase [Deltaproteobacteria bacterium]